MFRAIGIVLKPMHDHFIKRYIVITFRPDPSGVEPGTVEIKNFLQINSIVIIPLVFKPGELDTLVTLIQQPQGYIGVFVEFISGYTVIMNLRHLRRIAVLFVHNFPFHLVIIFGRATGPPLTDIDTHMGKTIDHAVQFRFAQFQQGAEI